ncbi:MAG: sigma-54-dependent Fis family transcriptional regulator [Deltaproteobacteria bacterium]|nr:MAG: sigma-54-dependent Fis family transcriptional regulator [Deltaproteobacteria bacterium]
MQIQEQILVVDPDPLDRAALCRMLEDMGFPVVTGRELADVTRLVTSDAFRMVIYASGQPSEADLDTIGAALTERPQTAWLLISGTPDVQVAVAAMKAGAMDVVMKPISEDQLRLLVAQAFSRAKASLEPAKTAGAAPFVQTKIITGHAGMLEVLARIRKVADATASVLIQGESGTGKEMVARYIHQESRRREKPFIAVNCAALPESLLETELFGHEKGAFTGASERKAGKFELADGGTLLLDEITEMQFHLQAKLLRVIQEREVDRVGGTYPVPVDVRVLATTNRDIRQCVADGDFREDLYYRLDIIPLRIPPLRERPGDIPLLAAHFIEKYNRIDGRDVKGLTAGAGDRLQAFPFKGNVRELENIIHRAVLLCSGDEITEADLLIDVSMETAPSLHQGGEKADGNTVFPLNDAPLREIEKHAIFRTLDKTDGNRTRAAELLGISVRTLRNKLNEYKAEAGLTGTG